MLRIRRLDWASAVHGRVRAQPHSFCLAYLFVKPFAVSPVCRRLALRFTCRLRCTPSFRRAQSAGPKRPPVATACGRATTACGARICAKLVRMRPKRSRDDGGHAARNSTRGLDTSLAALLGGKKIVRRDGAIVRTGETAIAQAALPAMPPSVPERKKCGSSSRCVAAVPETPRPPRMSVAAVSDIWRAAEATARLQWWRRRRSNAKDDDGQPLRPRPLTP